MLFVSIWKKIVISLSFYLLLGPLNIFEQPETPYRECTGYDQFIQSIHCQFFHSKSSFYSHPKFKSFIRNYFHTCAVIVNKVVQLFSRETLFVEMPPHLTKFAFHTLNCISTITEDADDYLSVIFDNMEVDGELICVPCPELIELLTAFQVLICFLFMIDRVLV